MTTDPRWPAASTRRDVIVRYVLVSTSTTPADDGAQLATTAAAGGLLSRLAALAALARAGQRYYSVNRPRHPSIVHVVCSAHQTVQRT